MFPFVRSWVLPTDPPRLVLNLENNTRIVIPWERIIAFAEDGN